jgi:uncharacterized membrane protein (GlpM family)
MDSIFFFKLLLSFVVGSLWVTMGTVLAERYGTKVGGLVAGLPSTILLSLFFIAFTQSVEVAARATTIIPVVHGINCLFVVAYVWLLRINFWFALAGSLALWLILSLIFVACRFDSFFLGLIIYAALLGGSYFVLERKLSVRSEAGRPMRYTLPVILFRSLLGGFIIVVAVVLAKTGGPLLGGMFSVFPTMFVGALLITYFSHGASFSAGVMKASIIGAMSVVVYAIAVRFTYVPLGLAGGTVLSLAASAVSSILIHRYLFTRTT